MKNRAPKNITPVIVGLLIVIVGSMAWNMQESFSNRRREGLINKCKKDTDCKSTGQKCVNNQCK